MFHDGPNMALPEELNRQIANYCDENVIGRLGLVSKNLRAKVWVDFCPAKLAFVSLLTQMGLRKVDHLYPPGPPADVVASQKAAHEQLTNILKLLHINPRKEIRNIAIVPFYKHDHNYNDSNFASLAPLIIQLIKKNASVLQSLSWWICSDTASTPIEAVLSNKSDGPFSALRHLDLLDRNGMVVDMRTLLPGIASHCMPALETLRMGSYEAEYLFCDDPTPTKEALDAVSSTLRFVSFRCHESIGLETNVAANLIGFDDSCGQPSEDQEPTEPSVETFGIPLRKVLVNDMTLFGAALRQTEEEGGSPSLEQVTALFKRFFPGGEIDALQATEAERYDEASRRANALSFVPDSEDDILAWASSELEKLIKYSSTEYKGTTIRREGSIRIPEAPILNAAVHLSFVSPTEAHIGQLQRVLASSPANLRHLGNFLNYWRDPDTIPDAMFEDPDKTEADIPKIVQLICEHLNPEECAREIKDESVLRDATRNLWLATSHKSFKGKKSNSTLLTNYVYFCWRLSRGLIPSEIETGSKFAAIKKIVQQIHPQ